VSASRAAQEMPEAVTTISSSTTQHDEGTELSERAVTAWQHDDPMTKRPVTDHAGATAELAEAGCEPVSQYPGRNMS
jgi:hypothetical protein